ncbi:MAG: PecA family PE domain-processing aspartic protease [Mycobacterium sp.]|nr:PecA family PE domain-processing aspartic protease [Mycobacterium sp.]
MARRDGIRGNNRSRGAKARRRRLVGMGAGVGAFVAAAAAMATGSAAPAKADFEDLLDPIIQPIITSFADSLAGFDPAAATDLTSFGDSILASLNALDPSTAVSSAAEPAAAAAASSDPTSGTYDIPLSVAEGTEPTVQATVDGANTTLLADTGSSGLVIPYQDLGLTQLLDLGFPTGIGFSGYSGGVDYLYLTYNDASVDYGNGALDTTNAPVDVEIFSWPTSSTSPANFEAFLKDDDVTGILGIGPTGTGPTANPLEALGYDGVTVDIPKGDLIVDPNNPFSAIATVSGAPITDLSESVNGGTPVAVSDDVDSGGVFGTIPSSLVGTAGSVPNGDTISVFDGKTEVYSYTVEGDSPTVVSGNQIDSGVEPYLIEPIFINYANDTLNFD